MLESVADISGFALLKQLYELETDGVCQEISPNDSMFEGSREHYFSVGQSALQCVKLALLAAGKDQPRTILDFGCGWGRVLRALRAAFPGAQLAACDLLREATDFCANAFGAEPIPSTEDASQIRITQKFDLIWCGTLLTNVNANGFWALLRLFDSLLEPDGVLVFTTHGPFVATRISTGAFTYGLNPSVIPDLVKEYEATGFGYQDYPEEVRVGLGVKSYGISISAPAWVCRQIERLPNLHLLAYTERAWDNHQDSVACMRSSSDD